ncbi:MAG: hypothetical protein BWY82_01033 [Verrucomicrobia bacterium ADurb.Bin474]|nr:MAG: hypothetical protein BWY82_01033 [Verrucomicrobia bacterium ADurb.Bin474]
MNSPVARILLRLANNIGRAIPIIGSAKALMLTLNPKNDTNQKVVVVPMLAPMIIPIASVRVSSPALTKLTIITVVADDDWTRQVTENPVPTAAKRFCVTVRMALRSWSPESFCSDSDMIFIPKRNMPRLPSAEKKDPIMVRDYAYQSLGEKKRKSRMRDAKMRL